MNGNVRRISPLRPSSSGIATLLTAALIVQSCKSDQGTPPVIHVETASVVAGTLILPTSPQTGVAPVTQSSWAPAALEELLAPIALYPDQLLAQVLAASINSQEVLDAGNWLLQNQNLKGKELDAAAEKLGFGPAMRALMPFPSVIDMMCQEIDWTRQLGSAFSSDQKSVLDAVQRLRKQAADMGNLKTTPQQTVSTKSEGGNVYVEVKPADPQVIYVPQYNAQAVYTTPAPATSTTTVVHEDDDDEGEAALLGGLVGFGVGMLVGSAFDNDYYYPSWGYGGMYYGARPFYPPAYAYRPAYGAGFRPAYGYTSPAGYRNNYGNIRSNNNVVINNKNYYNRFNNNQNLRAGNARSPIADARPSQRPADRVDRDRDRTDRDRQGQRPGVDTRDTRPAAGQSWKGQPTYAGARDQGTGRRDQASSTRPGSPTREARPEKSSAARPSAGTREASRVDRGYDASSRPSASPQQGKAGLSQATARSSDRSSTPRNSAFSGAESQGGGNFARSASARGNASAGSRQTSSRARRR